MGSKNISPVKINDCFPESFSFFNLGEVSRIKESKIEESKLTQTSVVCFSLLDPVWTDVTLGTCSVVYKGETIDDESLLIELANIAVGKFASAFAKSSGMNVSISPPKTLDSKNSVHKKIIVGLTESVNLARNWQVYEYSQKNTNRLIRFAVVYTAAPTGVA